MPRTLEFRRAQRERMIQRVMRWMCHDYDYSANGRHHADRARLRDRAVRRHASRQVCSTCCGNQRRFTGQPSMQERRWLCDDGEG